MYRRFLNWKKLIDSSSHGWSVLFWTFHILYKVIITTCYIFYCDHLFFFASVKLLQILRLFQKLLWYYFYSNVFPRTQRNYYSLKLWNRNQIRHFLTAYKEMFNWDASIYSVSQFLNNSPDLLLCTSSDFSNYRWNLTVLFDDHSQVVLNNYSLLNVGN